MSYSFTVKVSRKADVEQAVREEFSKVIAQQPIHEKDQEQAVAAANSMVNVLADDDTKDVRVSVNGYLSWQDHGEKRIMSASVSTTASLHDRSV